MSINISTWPEDGVILYDGDCLLCSRWMTWVVKNDPAQIFRFTATTSPYGRQLAVQLGIEADNPQTNAAIIGGKAYTYSDAALAIAGHLPGWGWVRVFSLIPRPLRDVFYMFIARNRINWFGRPQACDLPGPEMLGRIITNASD